MAAIWDSLRHPANSEALIWFGGGLCAFSFFAGSLCAFAFFRQQSARTAQGNVSFNRHGLFGWMLISLITALTSVLLLFAGSRSLPEIVHEAESATESAAMR